MPEELGPVVGGTAVDFSLEDDSSHQIGMQQIVGENGVMLAFIHGTWCMGCVQTLYQLQRHAHTYEKEGVKIAVVSSDPPHRLNAFRRSAASNISFSLISDQKGALREQYNLHQASALLLIDKARTIQEKFVDPAHHRIPGHYKLLETVRKKLF